ncbi:MAG TPA: PH domain-containing protein [Propionibacteriaceae bacterium]|nr:PH domain-containing protein [Propionibacteriaceae bacterium]
MTPSFVAYPRGPRWAAIGFSLVLVVGSLVVGIALGPDVRSRFTAFQVVTLLVFLLVMITFMCALGFSTVRVLPKGLWFRNGLRTHELPWSDVGEILFRPGAPWPLVVLKGASAEGDHETMMLMGIQGSDKHYARAQYDALRIAIAAARAAEGEEQR